MFTRKISAKRKADAESVTRSVIFPSSLREISEGVGPWRNLQEMFADAVAHRTVIIQAKIRAELNGTDPDSSEDLETFSAE